MKLLVLSCWPAPCARRRPPPRITAGAAMTRPSRSPSPGRSSTSKYENPHATITVKGSRQDMDRDARADLAHEEPRRDRAGRRGGQDGLGLRLSVDGREGRDARRAHHGRRQDLRDALMLDSAPAVFVALEGSGLGQTIRQSSWIYMAANVGHIVSLVVFAGAVAVLDLRMVGAFAATAPGQVLTRRAARRHAGVSRPRCSPARCCSPPRQAT